MRFRFCLILSLFIAASLALTPSQQTLQQLYNGYFEQAGLSDPTTLISCFDDSSATLTVNFIGTVLQQLANYDIFDLDATVQNYQKALSPAVATCSNANAEYQNVQKAYNMSGLTLGQIEVQVANYAFLNLAKVHDEADSANTAFKAGTYVEVGKQGGILAQAIFGGSMKAIEVKDAQADLQLMADGFWEFVGLPDPTTLSSCFDENSANITVTFIGALLNDLANSNIKAAEQDLQNFQTDLPNATAVCINSNPEMQQVLEAYNMYGLTIPQITTKIETYAVFHLLQLHHDAGIANSDFQAGNYKAVGQEGGQMIQNVFGKNTSTVSSQYDRFGLNADNQKLLEKLITQASIPSDDPIADITGLFDGFWEQANLADPTTPIACFDDPNAQITLTFVATIFSDLANDDLLDLPSAIKSFQSQISPTVLSCLSSDPQIQQVGQAYGISGASPTVLVAKVAKYALLHAGEFHQTTVQMNTDLTSAQYDAAGKVAGQLLQAIMAGRFQSIHQI